MNKTLKNIYSLLIVMPFPLLIITAVFALSGCFSHWNGNDNETRIILMLNGSAAGRAAADDLYPPDDIEILNQLEHTITLQNGTQEITLHASGGGNINAVVPSGLWNISVNTYLENIIYARGSSETNLQQGEDNFVSVSMYKAFYTITLIEDTTDEIEAGTDYGSILVQNRAGEGDVVTLTLNFERGYRLKYINSDPSVNFNGDGNTRTFTMPAENITIYALVEPVPKFYVYIDDPMPNGTITANPDWGYEGENTLIELTVNPAPYHRLKPNTLTLNSNQYVELIKQNNSTYTFNLPDEDVTVSAEFEEISSANVTIIVFEGFEHELFDLTPNIEDDLYWGDTLQVTVNTTYDTYQWYLDGTLHGETNNEINLYISDGFGIGIHSLMAVVTKNNIPHSKELIFRVKYKDI